MSSIAMLPPTTTMSVEQALEHALHRGLSDVLIIGWDEGSLCVLSSRMSRMDALWLAEKGKQWALDA